MNAELEVMNILDNLGSTDKYNSSKLKEFLDTMKFTSINTKELNLLLRILGEMTSTPTGTSDTYKALVSEDFVEVPVSMKRFIEDEDYLGIFCKTLYPFWKNVLIDIIDNDKGYLEVALSGAIGIGKTHIGCILMLRCLYYLMCLRDPHKYLGVSQTIALVFLNLNLDLAEGVGWDRFNKGAMSSPWFRRYGSIDGKKYKVYRPDKDISAIIASNNDHMIGKDVFCVAEGTLITINGNVEVPIEDLDEKFYKGESLLGYDLDNSNFVDSKFEGLTESYSDESYTFEFCNGKKIEVTYNHKFLTQYGYVPASILYKWSEVGLLDYIEIISENKEDD